MTATPPMIPPAIAPTLGPELDDFEAVEIVEGAADEATQAVIWHWLQVGGTSEQIWPSGHDSGQLGVSGPHSTHRRKRDGNEAGTELVGSFEKVLEYELDP